MFSGNDKQIMTHVRDKHNHSWFKNVTLIIFSHDTKSNNKKDQGYILCKLLS